MFWAATEQGQNETFRSEVATHELPNKLFSSVVVLALFEASSGSAQGFPQSPKTRYSSVGKRNRTKTFILCAKTNADGSFCPACHPNKPLSSTVVGLIALLCPIHSTVAFFL
jgi:hypothetical protein